MFDAGPPARRLSVVSVSAMVHKFKDTKLSSVALKSDKVTWVAPAGGSSAAERYRYLCLKQQFLKGGLLRSRLRVRLAAWRYLSGLP